MQKSKFMDDERVGAFSAAVILVVAVAKTGVAIFNALKEKKKTSS